MATCIIDKQYYNLVKGEGRGVINSGRNDYIVKCLNILDKKQFHKLSKDPTKTFEKKTQGVLRIVKLHLEEKEYKKFYPTV